VPGEPAQVGAGAVRLGARRGSSSATTQGRPPLDRAKHLAPPSGAATHRALSGSRQGMRHA
jgi:hypothetical protein